MVTKKLNALFLFLTKPFHGLKNHPVLYHGEHISIVNFGIFAALDGMAILLVFYWAMYARFVYLNQQFFTMTLVAPLFVWGGAKLYFFAALGRKFLNRPMKYLVQTGFYVQGGIIGALIWGIVASLFLNVSFFVLADALCLGTFLGQFFGRLGCFNYGCCYGKETHSPCGLHYHNCESKVLRIHPELQDVKLYPTQLYEAMANLSMFMIMLFVYNTTNRLGLTTVVFFAYQGIIRILLEFYRGDIYFNNKRNWMTFYASVISVVAGIMLFFAGPFIDGAFFVASERLAPMTLANLMMMFSSYINVPVITLVAGVFLFIGYGIHGTTIGYFPNLREWMKDKGYERRQI